MKFHLSAALAMLSITLYSTLGFAAGHDTAAGDIAFTNAYVRAVTGGQKNSAVFMTLTNKGHQEHVLTAVTGSVASSIELHTHVDDGGIMRMRPIDRITIPAGGSTELKPGGLHIMLIGLTEDLKEGAMVHLDLKFADGSTTMLMAPVKAVAPMGEHMGHEHEEQKGMQEHKHNM